MPEPARGSGVDERALRGFDAHRLPLLVATVALLTALAAWSRFVQDDAFISLRYAAHLVHGEGLVFNPGERVEGYTNFLWTLLLALPLALGVDPIAFAHGVGLACFAGSLVLTERLARAVTGSARLGALALVLVGTNASFVAFATGGLETSLQALLFTAIAVRTVALLGGAPWRAGRLAALSVLAALALATRLDAGAYLAVVALALALRWLRTPADARTRLAQAAWLVGPGALLLAPWLAWKLAYYGALLPNTAIAKLQPWSQSWRVGVFYLATFASSYLLWPLLALALWRARPLVAAADGAVAFLAAALGVWALYLVRVGGDFMEFRFLVPVLPLAAALLAWGLAHAALARWLRVGCVGLVLAGSLHHALRFDAAPWIQSRQALARSLDAPGYDWIGIGRALRGVFGDDSPVGIATTAAGAIPFHSRMRTVDMLGLSDPGIARRGFALPPLRSTPGHSRLARLPQLLERDVHLVIGHPHVVRDDAPRERLDLAAAGRRFWIPDLASARLPATAPLEVVELPIGDGWAVQLLYLTRHPAVDAAIREHGLRTRPVDH
jgi:arabinofuranosyltransferase